MSPIEIKCPACGAKPGEHCAGIVNAARTLAEPHGLRVLAAQAFPKLEVENELEQARTKRAQQLEAEEVKQVQDRAAIALNALPPGTDSEHVQALFVAAIGLSDARGIPREGLIDMFAELAKSLPVVAVRG